VRAGLFGTKESFVPLAEARVSGDRISVQYDKAFVKDAPNIDEGGTPFRGSRARAVRLLQPQQ
jgi:hypothetical protein